MRIAAVIPAFNEAATVTEIVERTLPHAQSVIVVDDGSTDDTVERVRALPVALIENDTNLGKSASLARGFAAALECSVNAVVTLDADGQHHPEDIPRLVEKAVEYPGDLIIGARLEGRDRMPRSRRFGNRQADFWISWAAGYPIRDSQSGFRLYPAALLDRLAVEEGRGNGFVFESQVLIEAARVGCYARIVPIDTIYGRSLRGSHYRTASDTTRIVRMVAGKLIRSGLYPLGLLRSLGWLPHPDMARVQNQAGSPDAMR
jgi:glycosyltransferase involved in cell wall biosynthesis